MEGYPLTYDSGVNATEYVINQSMADVWRELQQYRVALEVMEQHPSVLQEFKERLSRIW